ncbi:MAG: hypothetical protein HFG32_13940 [Eubacterium sp.]|nr:hypothetical protein [Eubacterium sp.]
MWISKKRFRNLEERVADLEKEVQRQPLEIIKVLSDIRKDEMTKASPKHHWKTKGKR